MIHFAETLFAISLRIALISVSGGLTGVVGFHAGSWLDVSSASINFSAFFGSLITMFVKILDVAIYNTSYRIIRHLFVHPLSHLYYIHLLSKNQYSLAPAEKI